MGIKVLLPAEIEQDWRFDRKHAYVAKSAGVSTGITFLLPAEAK